MSPIDSAYPWIGLKKDGGGSALEALVPWGGGVEPKVLPLGFLWLVDKASLVWVLEEDCSNEEISKLIPWPEGLDSCCYDE
jgi:hypothetical protein